MSVVTEIAHIPLQAGIDIESPSSSYSLVFSSLLSLLRDAKGSQRVLWSRQIEHTGVLEVLIGKYAVYKTYTAGTDGTA
jgi:hypothetical protein